MTFGEYLKQHRARLGLTQPEAAVRIGIEQSYLSKLETGRSVPSGEVYKKLVDAFGIETQAMLSVLPPAELDRLGEIEVIRELLLRSHRDGRKVLRRWLLAGLGLLAFGGGLVALARLDRDRTVQVFTYQSAGLIRPGESLNIFDSVDDQPDRKAPDYAQRITRRDDLVRRIDDQTKVLVDFKGPSFIESLPEGRRAWQLVGGSQVRQPGRLRWAGPPGWALILAGLACFFVGWRWPKAGA